MSVANKKKAGCCGCNACAEICPKHCVEMKADAKGFLYPRVDKRKCVECGLCEKVCPFQPKERGLAFPLAAFAGYNRDAEAYQGSSSGGAAYVFSEYIIGQGGVVYGCVANGLEIHHVRVDNIKQLPSLQGSKYVQSDVRGLFAQVANDLKKQFPVLFIGTPCQVAGLKNYIRVIPPRLHLVDLICHGVPSGKMLASHAALKAPGQQIKRVSFRRGSEFRMELSGEGSFCYDCSPYYKDAYLRSFMMGFTYRPSCYHCPFAASERVGDVSIGDFWGLRAMGDDWPEVRNGISLILPCTEKGSRLVHAVADKLAVYERTVEEAVAGNTQLRHPMPRAVRSRAFNLLWPLFPFDVAVWLSLADQLLISLKRRGIKILSNGFRKQ